MRSFRPGLYLLLGLLPIVLLADQAPLKELGAFPFNDSGSAGRTFPFADAGCTVIYGTDGEVALGGNNEDYRNPATMVWFLPPEDGKFGQALFGYEGFAWQGGVNDQGLFFDALGVGQEVRVSQGSKIRYEGALPEKALSECAEISCVTELFSTYHTYDTWSHQYMFGDAQGNSVIIEPYRNIPGGQTFQVVENFYQSTTDLNNCWNCRRYWTARNMFEDARGGITVDLIRDILNAVHLEGDYPTLYSNVYDLKGGLIYLYFFHNFAEVVVFDLAEELAQGYHAYALADLFTQTAAYDEWAAPEFARVEEIKAGYQEVPYDPQAYLPYLGDFQGPADMDLASPYYTVAFERDELVLKLTPDKVWLKLIPISDRSFYHASTFTAFEITFQDDDSGQVNQFQYKDQTGEYLFERIEREPEPEEGQPAREGPFSEIWTKLFAFSGTYTFKLSLIILGLVILQTLISYLRSLLE